jgi:hypothetical protein
MKNLIIVFFLTGVIFSSCLKDSGHLEVTYYEANAIYGDLSAIRQQPVNLKDGNPWYTDAAAIVNPGKIYIGDKYILIGEEEKGIHVYNNEDITNPIKINFINVPGNREFFVLGGSLYAESYYDIVKYDISSLEEVKEIGRCPNFINEEVKNDEGHSLLGFTFQQVTKTLSKDSDIYDDILDDNIVYYDFAQNIIPRSAVPSSFSGNSSGHSGTVNRLSVYNEFLYIVNRNKIITIDESSMTVTSRILGASSEMETVIPYQDKLFIGSRTSMDIYDIANPHQPHHEYAFNHVESCDPVLPYNSAAYVTLRTGDFADCPGNTNALVVLDISNLEYPKHVFEMAMHNPFGMAVIDDKLFVGEGDYGLAVFNIENPLRPTNKVSIEIEAYDIMPHPTIKNLILVAGENGLNQITIGPDQSIYINSTIQF